MSMIGLMSAGGTPDAQISLNSVAVFGEQYNRNLMASAGFKIAADKKIYQTVNGFESEIGTWCGAGASASSYEVFATSSGGVPDTFVDTPAGPLGSWLGLGSDRSWSITSSSGIFSRLNPHSAILTLEIRNASTQRRVALATVTLWVRVF